MVDDDDDGDESPSPEPRMDSGSALPREIMAWRRLRVVKRDETFSLIFFLRETEYMELELRSVEHQGAHQANWAQPPLIKGRHFRGKCDFVLAVVQHAVVPRHLVWQRDT